MGDAPGIERIERAIRVQARQVEKLQLGLIPVLLPIIAQGLVPQPDLLMHGRSNVADQPDGLENADRLILALDADPVNLAVKDVLDLRPGAFADQDADTVLLGNAFQTRAEIDRIAHHRVRLAHLGTHVTDRHRAGIDAHPDV